MLSKSVPSPKKSIFPPPPFLSPLMASTSGLPGPLLFPPGFADSASPDLFGPFAAAAMFSAKGRPGLCAMPPKPPAPAQMPAPLSPAFQANQMRLLQNLHFLNFARFMLSSRANGGVALELNNEAGKGKREQSSLQLRFGSRCLLLRAAENALGEF